MAHSDEDGTAFRLVMWLVLALVGVLVVSLAAGVWLMLFRPATDIAAGQPVQVEVPDGASTALIAAALADAGVVDNQAMFRLRSRLNGADGQLKPGVYDLTTGMSYRAAIERLEKGPPVEYVTVTIPEGFTVDQVAERFERELGIPAAETLALVKGGASTFAEGHPYVADAYGGSLEGYLFPKTYRIKKGATAKEAVETLLDQFDKEIAAVDLAAEAGFTPAQIVTIASMIERETKVAEERRLVSSVIRNRLARGMRLEIDATIEYVLPGNRFRLSWRDVQLDSPYNTYRNAGLPPGPISSPGLESLKAAADPARTDYLYYVLTGKDGTHTFATNRADFLIAKRKSKEVFGK